jgi:peptidoglycan/LPS O-acetylase OafA/YrhL
MLPFSLNNAAFFPHGVLNFILRRARRILPPYYAALLGSVIIVLLVPSIRHLVSPEAALYEQSSFKAAIVSHLFLVHNLWDGMIYRINGPMWSVATEWQIYFIFAFILIPLRNKMGIVAPIAFGFALGVLTSRIGLNEAHFWFIGSFALGMAGAEVAVSTKFAKSALKSQIGMICSTTVVASVIAIAILHHYRASEILNDFFLSLGTTAVISYFVIISRLPVLPAGWSTQVYKLFSHPWPVKLGKFSYSLYLVHYPLVCVLMVISARMGLSVYQDIAWAALLVLPAIIGIAYLFHIAFERPYLNIQQPRSV